jgi:hypothetical protein
MGNNMNTDTVSKGAGYKLNALTDYMVNEKAFDLLCETAGRDHGYKRKQLWVNLHANSRGDGVVVFDDTEGREVASVMVEKHSVILYIRGDSDQYMKDECSFGLISSKQEKRRQRVAGSAWYQRNIEDLKDVYLQFREIGPEGRGWSGLDSEIRFRLDEICDDFELYQICASLDMTELSDLAQTIEDVIDNEMALEQVCALRALPTYVDGVMVARQWLSAKSLDYRARLSLQLQQIAEPMWKSQFSPHVDAMACMKWDAVKAVT